MKKTLFCFSLFLALNTSAQKIYRTEIFNSAIKTLHIGFPSDSYESFILELNGSNQLQFSFDEMSHEGHAYSYKVLHCNADWTASSLNSNEYMSLFNTASITDYALSVNTSFLYTHYKFLLPNDQIGFKISGNYVAFIYEDNIEDKPIAQVCFSIVDPKVSISGKVRGNTDTELSGRLQQLDFDVSLSGYTVRDPNEEIKIVVRQNNRTDNQVAGIKPTYFNGSKLSYINNRDLIFEGGNEYHRFDISSVYVGGEGVQKMQYVRPNYEAFLYANRIQADRPYMQEKDVNGKYVIHLQKAEDDAVEADYMNVHVVLPSPQPFFDGQIYLGGEFNHNLMNDDVRMKYDMTEGVYFKTLFLKQGGYNYQYWFVPKGEKKASTARIDGTYWQTGNEYTIYVYQRPWGERYDKLIGVKIIE